MAHEAAIDRRARRRALELPAQLVEDRPGTPAGMAASHLDYAGLDLGRHLVRTPIRFGALVGQCGEAVGGVADEPAMKGAAIAGVGVVQSALEGLATRREYLRHGAFDWSASAPNTRLGKQRFVVAILGLRLAGGVALLLAFVLEVIAIGWTLAAATSIYLRWRRGAGDDGGDQAAQRARVEILDRLAIGLADVPNVCNFEAAEITVGGRSLAALRAATLTARIRVEILLIGSGLAVPEWSEDGDAFLTVLHGAAEGLPAVEARDHRGVGLRKLIKRMLVSEYRWNLEATSSMRFQSSPDAISATAS